MKLGHRALINVNAFSAAISLVTADTLTKIRIHSGGRIQPFVTLIRAIHTTENLIDFVFLVKIVSSFSERFTDFSRSIA